MRLISARVRGIGRLVDTKLNLDAKVIAVVGPNEAGKSTLLRALEYLSSGAESVPAAERSRAAEVSDETRSIEVKFVLEDEDLQTLEDLDLREKPRQVTFIRQAGGRVFVDITPMPVRSTVRLEAALPELTAALVDNAWSDWLGDNTYDDPGGDASRHFGNELTELIDRVRLMIDDPTGDSAEDLHQAAIDLANALDPDDALAMPLHEALKEVAQCVQIADPAPIARTRLWSRSPDFVLFGEHDRSLKSTYTIDDALVAAPPPALRNLAGAAQFDLGELWRSFGDLSRRSTAILKANKRLDLVFSRAWKQARLTVSLEVDGDQLRIHLLEKGETVTVFDERSAGLRMFVALTAFLQAHGTTRPPVLLIDEAENHLHLDAQADLVNMFVLQESATRVIYTTHSPGCLPPDLGTGIRAVVPRSDGSQVSDVRNSFWGSGPGFSPLMVAMGAAAAAFTPARRAVLTEGATEMILLPTLLRVATGLTEMPYQVAPGLSEAPTRLLPSLDLEAARVAYLVDGDEGGRALAVSLIRSGVPEGAIFELPVPGVENLLCPTVYRGAFASLLSECNPDAFDIPEVPPIAVGAHEASWATFLESWAQGNGLSAPSKIAVANRLVESGRVVLSPDGEQALQDLHEHIQEVLAPSGAP
ncbi:AAA family ATPase [Cellulomonas iranensis]|uniref:AAA family ATPase n=1 Tax=Cellulomonas iranensis TaxID=76862 RepID=UPI003D7E6472